MFYHCPKCWHQQPASGTCDKCGLNMAAYWTAQLATARAVLVKEEGTNMEESANQAIGTINSVGRLWGTPSCFWDRSLPITFLPGSDEDERAVQYVPANLEGS
jgi:hypothetical protein